MPNISQFYKLVAPYARGLNEENPAHFIGEQTNFFNTISTNEHKKLTSILKKIIRIHPEKAQREIHKVLNSFVLATPYGRENYLERAKQSLENKFDNIEISSGHWLEEQFRKNDPILWEKLNSLEYQDTKNNFTVQVSKQAPEIKKYVDNISACISNKPLSEMQKLTDDIGTIHIVGIDREQKEALDKPVSNYNKLNIGWMLLFVYQTKDMQEKQIIVDSVFVKDKKLLCGMLQSVADIADYMGVSVLDKTISINYLNTHSGKKTDLYEQQQELFKIGKPHEIRRYTRARIPLENEGFYILNKKH